MKKIFLLGLLIFLIVLLFINSTEIKEDNIEEIEEVIEDIELMEDDKSYPVSKNSSYAEVGYMLIKMVNEFTKEITNKSYETIDGYEGYSYLSENLINKLNEMDDVKRTVEMYRNSQLIKTMKNEPYTTICFENEEKATSFTNIIEIYLVKNIFN